MIKDYPALSILLAFFFAWGLTGTTPISSWAEFIKEEGLLLAQAGSVGTNQNLPDLVFTSVSGNNRGSTMVVGIKNVGETEAGPFILRATPTAGMSASAPLYLGATVSLAPKTSRIVFLYPQQYNEGNFVSSKTYTNYRFKIDYGNTVTEKSETNNEVVADILLSHGYKKDIVGLFIDTSTSTPNIPAKASIVDYWQPTPGPRRNDPGVPVTNAEPLRVDVRQERMTLDAAPEELVILASQSVIRARPIIDNPVLPIFTTQLELFNKAFYGATEGHAGPYKSFTLTPDRPLPSTSGLFPYIMEIDPENKVPEYWETNNTTEFAIDFSGNIPTIAPPPVPSPNPIYIEAIPTIANPKLPAFRAGPIPIDLPPDEARALDYFISGVSAVGEWKQERAGFNDVQIGRIASIRVQFCTKNYINGLRTCKTREIPSSNPEGYVFKNTEMVSGTEYKVTVDYRNDAPEYDETNNSGFFRVTWGQFRGSHGLGVNQDTYHSLVDFSLAHLNVIPTPAATPPSQDQKINPFPQTIPPQIPPTPLFPTPGTPTAIPPIDTPIGETGTSFGTCPNLTLNLSADDSGNQVRLLQEFLRNTVINGQSVHPTGEVTGFFGPITERAIQRLQSLAGIVSSGDPDTTGYGYVGPRTRAFIALNCGGIGNIPTTDMGAPVLSDDGNIEEESDDESAGQITSGIPFVPALASGDPDLVVILHSAGSSSTGESPTQITARVTNIGGPVSGGASVTVTATPSGEGPVRHVYRGTTSVGGLVVLTSLTPGLDVPAAPYSYVLRVDSENVVTESNEANNETNILIQPTN